MGRPKKQLDEIEIEEKNLMMNTNENLPAIKQIVRALAKGMPNPDAGMFSEAEVSNYVSEWVAKGYKIVNVSFLENVPEGAISMLYVLVRNDVLAG